MVYNLTVANDHTYFVGAEGVLGHNFGCKKYPRPTFDTWDHIFYGATGRKSRPTGIHHSFLARNQGINIIKLPKGQRAGFYQAYNRKRGYKKG